MITFDILSSLLVLIMLIIQVEVNAVKFQQEEDTSLSMSGSPILDKNVTSVRHCAQLCTATSACVSANYDTETSSCHLIDTINTWKSENHGNTALISDRYIGGKLSL